MRKGAGFQEGESSTKFRRWVANNSSGYPVVSAMMQAGHHVIVVEAAYGPGSFMISGGPLVSFTSWDQVEVEVKMNTPGVADGLVRMWVNGALYIERTNIEFRGPTPSSVSSLGKLIPSTTTFSSDMFFIQCGLGALYVDRPAVGDARIGIVGAAGPTDTVAPSIPTGLAINGNVLSWTASTDSGTPTSGVSGYDIAQCGPTFPCTATTVVANRTTTNYTANLTPGEAYSFKVRANDAAGNSSPFTAQVDLAAAPTTNRSIGFTDTFTRADNTDAGTDWTGGYTGQDALRITSNTLQATSTSLAVEGVSGYSAPNDQWFKGTLITWGTGVKSAALGVRATNPATWTSYYCKVSSASPLFSIVEVTAGTPANLVTTDTVTPAQGDTYYCQIQGTTIRFIKLVGTTEILVLSTADASLASGRVSAYLSNATAGQARWDNVSAGGFSSASAGTIAIDNISNSAAGNVTNTITWNHTVGSSGTNRELVVCTYARDSVAGDVVVSSVTAGGFPLTKIRNDTASGTFLSTEIWSVLAPSTGTLPIVVTWAQPLSGYGVASAISLTGVDQAAPNDANGGATGTSATISGAITTAADNALIVDCALAQAAALTITGGQTAGANRSTTGTADDTGLSTFTKTPAGAKTLSYSQNAAQVFALSAASFKPATVLPVVAPKIVSMVASTTGMTVTYDATTPTKIRVDRGNNTGSVLLQDTYDISSFPGGVLTRTWEPGLEYIGAHAIDAAGVENLVNYIYGSNASGPSAGFSAALRQTAAVLSNGLPANTLPSGTTSTTLSAHVDVSCDARYSTSDVAFSAMSASNVMTVNSLTASATISGLTNNSSTVYYIACSYTNEANETYENTASDNLAVTIAVAAAPGDTTLPSTITNLICDVLGSCAWPLATDNIAVRGYRISLSTDACVTFYFISNPTAPPYQFPSLSNGQAYCAVVRAEDTSGNLSAADSNQATFTTLPFLDVIPPSDMSGIRECGIFRVSVLICFNPPTDNIGVQSTTIQSCQGAGCVNFSNAVTTNIGTQTVLSASLVSGTVNRFRGFHSDGTNQSVNFSEIIDITTASVGLGRPRADLRFGTTRSTPSTKHPSTNRPARP
jgi:hypothetical protein